ncbi:hypothetical protein [Rhodoferax sp. GW822-FHT02A01]|uniref:hypothetical protein n=1 Tax=Rhodoferax sp. GW822-FHT02A01 TaxID=3141537 RepID=UPI00315C60FD
MDVHFRYRRSHKGASRSDQSPRLEKVASVMNVPEGVVYEFSKYLLSAVTSDFPEQQPQLCDAALQDIGKLERGEIDAAEWGGKYFSHFLTRSQATFEHVVYGESASWPLWSCTLGQYKAVLQGWRQFMDMPADIDSHLTVALPSDRP